MKLLSILTSFVVTACAVLLFAPASADAFCGFYVDGAGSDMFADATQVAMMREDTRTVLSMQNRYAGPPDDFALVIPVPIVLEEENVKTIEDEIFARIDTLTSPRLVEYWERDPCAQDYYMEDEAAGAGGTNQAQNQNANSGGVTVESQFKAGEYQIAVLSTEESTALEDWLTQNDYNIPDGAATFFEPYIQNGMYFFVARVNPEDVTFEDGEAVLSPLRFHYDTEEFSLPVRLGMINSGGEQDLIVNILARDQRYEVANYDNVTIPTNLEVGEEVADDFSTFYRALFADTVEENPGAAVTEYAWRATKCDPCPGPVPRGLQPGDVETLGADVLPGEQELAFSNDWVVTRLHMRYGSDELGEDLVFEEAEPIVGGREVYDEDGALEQGAQPASRNSFQGRYIIRHGWEGPVECDNPQWGNWGGPDGADQPSTDAAPGPNTTGEDVFADEDSVDLDSVVLDVTPEDRSGDGILDPTGSGGSGGSGGSACSAASSSGAPTGMLLVFLGLIGTLAIRRRR